MRAFFVFPAFALLLLAASGCKKPPGEARASVFQTVTAKEAAPAWKVTDIEGRPLDSAAFKGKVVVVDFWATWCPPCIAEVPGYVALQKKLGGDGLAIVGFSLDAGSDVVKAFMAKNGINYPVAVVDETMVAAFGNFSGIPTTFVIDREGNVRFKKTGGAPIEDLEQAVRSLL